MLTDTSGEVLRGKREVPMRREPEKAARAAKAKAKAKRAPVDLPEEALPLFEALRGWRGRTAKEQGVPAYVIFHDATLREIATLRPTTTAELGTISGVGENKLAKYGEQILDVLAGRETEGEEGAGGGAGGGEGAKSSVVDAVPAGGGHRAAAPSSDPEPEDDEALPEPPDDIDW